MGQWARSLGSHWKAPNGRQEAIPVANHRSILGVAVTEIPGFASLWGVVAWCIGVNSEKVSGKLEKLSNLGKWWVPSVGENH